MNHSPVEQRDAAGTPPRPTVKVGSAEPALADLKGAASDEALALITAEAERCRDAARQALGSLKEALEALERSYEEKIAGHGGQRQSAVGTFVERLVKGASAASDAAADRARAEARAELEQAQATLGGLRKELEAAREQLGVVRAQLQAEQSARATAETAAAEAEKKSAALAAAHDSELQALRADLTTQQAETARLLKQIGDEKAARARLVSAIQKAVDPADVSELVPDVKPAPEVNASSAKHEAAHPKSAAATGEPLKGPAADAPPEVVAYVQHLFTTLEAMYSSDVSAGRKSDDLLNRLTQNLRSARNVFRNHTGAADGAELPLFDQQLAELLANPEESAFCRHLGIAAYECAKLPDGR